MTKRTIACPKCKKRYSVSPEMAGKKMKCPACQAVFVLNLASETTRQTNVPQGQTRPATMANPQGTEVVGTNSSNPSTQDYARMGLDGPLAGEAELFPDNPAGSTQQLGLDNYATDPGFGQVDPTRFIEQKHDPTLDNPLHHNPALSHAQQLARDIRSDKIVDDIEADEEEVRKREFAKEIGAAISYVAVFTLVTMLMIYQIGTISGLFWWVMIVGYVVWAIYSNIRFLIRAFQTAPAHEVILTIFVPFYVIYFVIKYWKEVRYEAMVNLIVSLTLPVAMITSFIAAIFFALTMGVPPKPN